MEGYAAAKARLFERMGPEQIAILPHGDARLEAVAASHGGRRAWLGRYPGVVREGPTARVQLGGLDVRLPLGQVAVPGAHNQDNAACAALLALAVGAPPQAVVRGLPGLRALPHRMQIVPTTDGVCWINDSKATNIDAALAPGSWVLKVEPAVVLLGGRGQAQPRWIAGLRGRWPPSLRVDMSHVDHLRGGGFRRSRQELEGAGRPRASQAATLADRPCEAARGQRARPAQAVLLSPGCASFDAFDDFEHRGRCVRRARGRGGAPVTKPLGLAVLIAIYHRAHLHRAAHDPLGELGHEADEHRLRDPLPLRDPPGHRESPRGSPRRCGACSRLPYRTGAERGHGPLYFLCRSPCSAAVFSPLGQDRQGGHPLAARSVL